MQLSEEGFGGGLNLNAQVILAWQPSASAEVQLIPAYALASGEPRYAGPGAIAGELVFGRLRAESAGLTLRAAYGFLPSLTLQTYVQLFLARGRYTDYSRFFASAAPGRWFSAVAILHRAIRRRSARTFSKLRSR